MNGDYYNPHGLRLIPTSGSLILPDRHSKRKNLERKEWGNGEKKKKKKKRKRTPKHVTSAKAVHKFTKITRLSNDQITNCQPLRLVSCRLIPSPVYRAPAPASLRPSLLHSSPAPLPQPTWWQQPSLPPAHTVIYGRYPIAPRRAPQHRTTSARSLASCY